MTIYQADIPLKDTESLKTSTFSRCFAQPNPSHVALVDADRDSLMTREELRSLSLHLAHSLRHGLAQRGFGADLNRGDFILLFSPNHYLYHVTVLGAFAAGTPVACSSPAQTPGELAHQVRLTGATFFVVHLSLLEVFVKTMDIVGIPQDVYKTRTVILSPPHAPLPSGWASLDTLLDHGHHFEPEKFDGPAASQTAMVFFSSGTTSAPKAVELTHLNLNAHAEGMKFCGHAGPTKTVHACLPFSHVAGGLECVLGPLMVSSTVVFGQFSPDTFWEVVSKYKVTTTAVVPAIMAKLNLTPIRAGLDLSRLETICVGAAPIGVSVLTACYEHLKNHNSQFSIRQIYGMTETACGTHMSGPGREDKGNTIGRPIPGVSVRIVDDNGLDVRPGEEGELWARGPVIMKGYLNNPEATRDSFGPDGWLKTGDVAYADMDGYFYIVDRRKEFIKYNAYQVAPAALEAILMGHPQVADCGVIGVPSADGANELPKAYITPRDPALFKNRTFPTELQKWIEDKVSKHQYLRGGVELIDTIPRGASGKILRRELRQLAAKKLEKARL